MALTGSVIKAALQNLNTPDQFAEKLAKAIVDNLEVQVVVNIPASAVAVGAGVSAAPNPAPIPCTVTVKVM